MEVLQVLVAELTLVLKVPRARLVLMNVEEARSYCLGTRDVSCTVRLKLLDHTGTSHRVLPPLVVQRVDRTLAFVTLICDHIGVVVEVVPGVG